MTPERWQEIDKLLEQALEQEPGNRKLFLDSACAGDEELRREVETLLKAHDQGGSLLSSPALEPATWKSTNSLESLMGQSLSHYQILSRLGEGGMGIVYKARDTHLDRFVAIKVLPPELVADTDRKRRFVQEAKAASALKHPNIITVHDIASDNGTDFIVMEYVDGKTLGQMIPRRGMKLNDALKVAIQIADGLAKAHAAGIIHRDLKPGNIMVGEDSLVKVLDFGLAKLSERSQVEEAESTGTLQPHTEEGMILRTASYMSPEQAAGKPVDARSDIFSFGSVLYEMVTGQRAFQGDSKMSTLAAVLNQQPKSAREIARALPYDLDKIITRCLRKEPSRRFQGMDDLKVALQELKEELDSGTVLPEGAQISGKPTLASQLKWVTLGVAMIALTVAGWFWFVRFDTKPVGSLTAVPLTAYPGWESAPSFSPDGSQVAFEWSKTSRFEDADIYIKQIGVEGNPVQLTDNPAPDQNPAWSPDGRSIAFARLLPPDWKRIAYIIKPQRGGTERTISEFDVPSTFAPNPVNNPVKWCAWTADSKALVVAGKRPPGTSGALFLVSMETGEERQLTDPPLGSADFNPAVSPNGDVLAFSRGIFYGPTELCLLSLSKEAKPQGEPKTLPSDLLDITVNLFPAWTADGREIIFVSGFLAHRSLWRIAVANSAQLQRLAFERAWHPAVSRQGSRLAYSTWKIDSNIWRVEIPTSGEDPPQPVKIFFSTLPDAEPAYSPDGRQIAFASGRAGSMQIWVADSDGSNPEKLTSLEGFGAFRPRWSPDGQRITFYSRARDNRDIDVYVMHKDGSGLKRLTIGPSIDTNPGWSADGKWVYFQSLRNEGNGVRSEMWKVPVEGGQAVLVLGVRGGSPVESPDGKFLYYDKGWPADYSVWRRPTGGGEEIKVVDSLHPQAWGWVALNDGVYFISKPDEKGVSHIRFKDVTTGSIRTIAPIEYKVSQGLTVSPNRRSLLYSQVDESGSDLMLVENFR